MFKLPSGGTFVKAFLHASYKANDDGRGLVFCHLGAVWFAIIRGGKLRKPLHVRFLALHVSFFVSVHFFVPLWFARMEEGKLC